MRKKSVISLISYDAKLLSNSIRSYYDYVDEIVLGLDKDRITWSGNPFTFNYSEIIKELQKLDVDKKIVIIEENFHKSPVAIENDNYERNFLKAHCSNDWIFSIDADEVLINAKEFFYDWCPLVEDHYDKIDLAFTWFLPFKEFDDSILVIANNNNTWFSGDTQAFVTSKNKNFTYCRWTDGAKVIKSPLAVIHWSFCRPEKELEVKLNNFGHSDKTQGDPFFANWKVCNLNNYHELINFKTSGYGQNQWEKLIRVPKQHFDAIANNETRIIY